MNKPQTKLAKGETVIKEGYCGLGEGSRNKTFAPGHLYLTDRRLIIESRLETDRSVVTYALSALTEIHPLDDGFIFTVVKGEEALTETVILWGEVEPWLHAIEDARRDAPALTQAVKEARHYSPIEKRRRVVVYTAVGIVAAVLLIIALCIVVFSVWVSLQGGQ